MLKNKEKFLSDLEKSSTNPKRKKMRTGGYDGVDRTIFQWFLAKRTQYVPVHGVLWKEKPWTASSKQLDPPDFKASDFWLSNWKMRLVHIHVVLIFKSKLIFQKNFKVFLRHYVLFLILRPTSRQVEISISRNFFLVPSKFEISRVNFI